MLFRFTFNSFYDKIILLFGKGEKTQMSEKKSFLNVSISGITVIALVIVFILGATVFAIEYKSVSGKNKKLSEENAVLNSNIQEANSKNQNLESQNAAQKEEIQKITSSYNNKVNDLNKKIGDLNNEVSKIKATKAAASAKAAAAKKTVTKPNTPSVVSSTPQNLSASNTGGKVCYLTFDDGPSDNTLKILDILKTANAKATFFVVGTSKINYIKREYSEGHTVGLHSNTHDWSIYNSETAYYNDLNAISQKVKNIIGIDSKIIRFPGGGSNTISKKHSSGIMSRLTKSVQEKGYVYVDWNVSTGDADGNNVPVKRLMNNVISQAKGNGPICVLMHDTNAKGTTVSALPQIISYLRSKGYRFEALTTSSPVFHHRVNN